MNTERVPLKLDEYSRPSTFVNERGQSILCVAGLRGKVELPRGCTEIDLVYTAEQKPESFTLEYVSVNTSRIKGYKGLLFLGFLFLNGNMWNKGYRYVHVEY